MHAPFKIFVTKEKKDEEAFKTTLFELNFLMQIFSGASLSPYPEDLGKYVLEFSKFYFYLSFEDKSENFTKIKTDHLMIKESESVEAVKQIKGFITCQRSNVVKKVKNLGSISKVELDDVESYFIAHRPRNLILSLFIPFVFFFDEKEQKIVHWPVAGPKNFNCRVIKHYLVKKLQHNMMKGMLNTSSEMAYSVPFKMVSTSESDGNADSNIGSLFIDSRSTKPEFNNVRGTYSTSKDFEPLFQLFYVS